MLEYEALKGITMEYVYNGELYVLDDELYEEKIDDIMYQYIYYILDENINRYEVIVDDQNLQKLIIEAILSGVSSSVLFDLSKFTNKNDYLREKEELLRANKVLVTINQNSLIEKLDGETREKKEERFYHFIINFMRDHYSKEGINYQEIMFFTNDEFRRYIKFAYDISSCSHSAFFNQTYKLASNKKLTLDDALERKYR